MNSYMQYAFHFLEKRFHANQLAAAKGIGDDVVSGYSHASAEFPQASFADDDSSGQARHYYCNIIYHSCTSGEIDEVMHPGAVEAVGAINQCIAATQGAVVHVAYDTILAKFDSLDSVLSCAISVRLAVRRYSLCVGSARSLQFHIGIHCSDGLADHGRNQQAATDRPVRPNTPVHYGGIYCSKTVRARFENESSFKYFPLGKRYVKNIDVPVELFWIAFSEGQIIHPLQADTEVRTDTETSQKVFA